MLTRVLAILFLTACAARNPEPVAPVHRAPAPVMSTAGVGWLERAEREEEERPDLVLAAMELLGQTDHDDARSVQRVRAVQDAGS